MISLLPLQGASRRHLSRRDMLRLSAWGGLGLTLPVQQAVAGPGAPQVESATASRCIFIFLCGGPSQLDMWDLKPDAPDGIRGPFRPISTNVAGIQIGDMLPQVAQQADKLAIVRSMTHDTTSHDVGIMYTLLADSSPPTNQSFPPTRTDHPGLGAILRSHLGGLPEMPAWVTLPRPFTTGDRFYKGQSGGFLGPAFDPFFVDEPKRDSLDRKEFHVDSLRRADGIAASRLESRQNLLNALEVRGVSPLTSEETRNLQQYYDKAFSMLSAGGARRAFDLSREPEGIRDRYGRNEYGQSFLLARRLVEAGVRMVNVFWTYYGPDGCQFNLWDNHGSDQDVCGGYRRGVDMIKGDYCCPAFDRAYAALLSDLHGRGLLDETLVVVTGEFGRTPRINQFAGRDHWGACYSAVLAGGGIQGGQVYGASDRHAAYVKHSPVSPEDIGATVLSAFGIPAEAPVYEPTGRPVHSSKGQPLAALF